MRKFKNYIVLYLICCLSLLNLHVFAQRSSARVTVHPSEILIGEQAIINLEVIAPKGRNIIFPAYKDTLIAGIEVLMTLAPDTTIAQEVMTIRQQYVITSFDSTLYYIPHLTVIDGQDTINTNSLGLKVISPMLSDSTLSYLELLNTQQTDSIDFDMLGIADIKPVMPPKFVLSDYLTYLWLVPLAILLLILLGLGIYLIMNKKKKGYFFKPKVILPPHVIALQALDHLKAEKIWQQGQEKQYYTLVTDILREYIEERFMINAFEKTSHEILETVNIFTEADSSIESLRQVLTLSDLVKFAKYKPLPNENDLSLMNAYLFVNQTKVELPVPVDEHIEGGDKDQSENHNQKIDKSMDQNKANS